jgi:MYXO-CTERM domain-containing protein
VKFGTVADSSAARALSRSREQGQVSQRLPAGNVIVLGFAGTSNPAASLCTVTLSHHEKLDMRSNLLRQSLLGSLFLVCLAGVGSPTRAAAQNAGNAPADTHDDDNGFDEGLLGLLGLAGLLGLRRREHRDVNRTEVNRTATSRV